jgi:hypothetical protein
MRLQTGQSSTAAVPSDPVIEELRLDEKERQQLMEENQRLREELENQLDRVRYYYIHTTYHTHTPRERERRATRSKFNDTPIIQLTLIRLSKRTRRAVERQVEEIAQLQEFFANKLAEQGDVVTAIRDAIEQSLAHVEKVRVL